MLFFFLLINPSYFVGLAKRVRARLLLASTSEVYGGKSFVKYKRKVIGKYLFNMSPLFHACRVYKNWKLLKHNEQYFMVITVK